MNKETAKDIAISLIAKSAEAFDGFAFEDSDISDKDVQKILNEIGVQTSKMIARIEKKYDISLPNTTHDIIDTILYE